MQSLITDSALAAYRRRRYRQQPELRLWSLREAAAFVDEVGLCLFQPNRTVELPSLWGAVAGSDEPAPRWGQHGQLYERTWTWKDSLLSAGHHYYGRALGNYRLFLSRSLVPYLWALSDLNYGGEPDDYLELYQDGKLSVDAKDVYAVLRRRGPSSTTVMRRESGLYGKGKIWQRFERALDELQRGLLVSVVGVAHDNAWKYNFRYATLPDAFPQEVMLARGIASREAMGTVLAHCVDLVGASSVKETARLFHWSEERCLKAAQALLAEGKVLGHADGSLLLSARLAAQPMAETGS
ncbi:MAG: hypothetical protein M1401_08980 [Chloroflexi bacterium]|nr:hypothetical protein [Chloroflexota bacterium]